MKIEVCKGSVGLALYVDDKRVAGPRHNGIMETILSAEIAGTQSEALSSLSLSLSEAREEIERLKAASLHHETGERITRKDLNNAHRKGAEEGRLAAHLIDGIPAERQRDEALEALRKIHNFGQSAEPDHWKFRCMARDAARTALENSKANLADANTNPPLSDLSSLRKGAEVVGEAAAYDFVAGWHERQAKLFREMAEDDPRTAEPQRKRAFEAAIHHAASAAALRNRAADDRRAALVSCSREEQADG